MKAIDVPLEGTRLVEASAGTGKTHTITTLYVRLLLEADLGVEEIAVITFTKAATAELRDRIRTRIARALEACDGPNADDTELRNLFAERQASRDEDRRRLETALQSFDLAPISTIHSFCQRILGEFALESGQRFDDALLADEVSLWSEALGDVWVRTLAELDPQFVRWLRSKGASLRSLISGARHSWGAPGLRVLPETISGADPEHETIARTKIATRLHERLEAEKVDLERLFREAKGALNQNSYGPKRVSTRLSELVAAFERGDLPLSIDRFELFTPISMIAALKGGASVEDVPRHEILTLLSELLEKDREIIDDFDRRWHAIERRVLDETRQEIARRKRLRGVFSFGDLLDRLRAALESDHGRELAEKIASRFGAALVDEFQDTDPVQWEIIERLWAGPHRTLVLVGDPKQAIYSFRGADVFAYLRARLAAATVHPLHVNWRSDPRLLRALDVLWSSRPEPFRMAEIPYHRVRASPEHDDPPSAGAPLRIALLPNDDSKPIPVKRARELLSRAVAGEIVRLGEGERVLVRESGSAWRESRWGDFAVLCRTNAEAQGVRDALRSAGVPAVFHGDRSVFESTEAEELLTVLSAIADPTNARRVRTALATCLLGLTAGDLLELDGEEDLWDRRLATFWDWHREWLDRGFAHAARSVLEAEGLAVRLLSRPGGERAITNHLHLAELLHQASRRPARGPQELLEWFRREIEDARSSTSMAPEEVQLRLESDDDAVTLTTVHRAKGLEYPIVLCPYLWGHRSLEPRRDRFDVRFHDDEGRLVLDLGSDDFEANLRRADTERRQEERRLAYVALTRARHLCVVFWGRIAGAESSALADFLGGDAVRATDDSDLFEALRSLEGASGGTIAVGELSSNPGSASPTTASPPDIAPRESSRTAHEESWRVSSFTALVSGERALGWRAADGRDDDEDARESLLEERSSLPLGDFPRGARSGIAVHEILERVDFRDFDGISSIVETRLRAHGFDPIWCDPVERAIRASLEAPLPGVDGPLRLGDVATDRRISEMEFTASVDGHLSPSRLAHALGGARRRRELADYVERLADLGFSPFSGWIRGFVDLVFEHGGRWYLVDWKTNDLGRVPGDYAPERLMTSMAEHHYVLQYHLYAATLHRHLEHRLPGYDYELHFGGVFYVFLRAFGGESRHEDGVYHDRPPASVVTALADLIASPENTS